MQTGRLYVDVDKNERASESVTRFYYNVYI